MAIMPFFAPNAGGAAASEAVGKADKVNNKVEARSSRHGEHRLEWVRPTLVERKDLYTATLLA
ncbi:MAG: hypothetical protein EP343_17795 [Deltaproteobacteria bacterium]|nr:MAG: hypothetical protein EP343_17795 [Deltaproteobacteria bacterium]